MSNVQRKLSDLSVKGSVASFQTLIRVYLVHASMPGKGIETICESRLPSYWAQNLVDAYKYFAGLVDAGYQVLEQHGESYNVIRTKLKPGQNYLQIVYGTSCETRLLGGNI